MRRFLVVDDHPLFREALEKCVHLAASDVEILEAATIDEALAALASREIDLTILDLSLPGTTGLSGLVRLRKAFPQIQSSSFRATKILKSLQAHSPSAHAGTFPNRPRRMKSCVRSASCWEVRSIFPAAIA